MDNKQKHERTKKIFKYLGGALIGIGITFALIGLLDFFMSFGKGMPKSFWCLFVGFPLIGVGAVLLQFGFRREISRYIKDESVPIINEAMDELSPAVNSIANAVNNSKKNNDIECQCGNINDADSKFCDKCGKSLIKKCKECGAELDADSKFCNKCGKPLN